MVTYSHVLLSMQVTAVSAIQEVLLGEALESTQTR